ncbi:hypothetical protein BK133_00705 [Paenibacillus sp. FSL H8-0548]|uniref:DUF6382 domain-containing protein n=1 Tax=Paenibacillus sp. FSL H8-0548 TaxID=1920422 RepID=UPI00096BED02|nr:DUF6382 domain-containing protein [Paenibacillus sp. FSL H8-0548]OMF38760.1 hypothetical protein BK133_00705 [Paenibacillus sp. FSL H8-0548]
MQSFRIDFTMNQEHEMMLDRESGIYRSELDEIELHMLHSEQIPNFLPIDWFEMDGKVTFRYKLSGMKMLLHRLQQQPLTMEQYYTLILGITDALFECKNYMLRPEGCLLDEQYIFIGEDLHHIRIAYVPMKGGPEDQTIGAGDLLYLIVRFTSYIDHIDGEGLQRVLQPLAAKRWPLAELRAILLELIGTSPVAKPLRVEPEIKEQNLWHRSAQQLQPSSVPSELHYSDSVDYKAELNDQDRSIKAVEDALYLEESDDDEDEPNTKRKWIMAAGLIIAISCVWRFVYFAMETRQALLISSGLTLLLLSFFLLAVRRREIKQGYSKEDDMDWSRQRSIDGLFTEPSNRNVELERNATEPEMYAGALREQGADQPSAPLRVVVSNPVDTKVEPTMLIGRNTHQPPQAVEAEIWLQRSWEGQLSRLDLEEEFFRIGRMGERLSYEELASGVSRLHLEIENLKGEYRAKDLGSRNGSLLNGQAMIPYKSYKLAIGDIIHLAGVTGPSYELKKGDVNSGLSAAY